MHSVNHEIYVSVRPVIIETYRLAIKSTPMKKSISSFRKLRL